MAGLLKKYYNPSERSGGMTPFLKAEHLDENGTVFTVGDVREATTQYSDIFVDVKAGREEYTLGLKGDSVLCSQLVDALGDDERKWNGKRIKLYLAKGRYINATDVKSTPNGGGKKRPTKAAKGKKR